MEWDWNLSKRIHWKILWNQWNCGKIYIGKDFPDEFAHGKDKTVLKGPNLKAKANAALAIGELIQIPDNKSFSVDHDNKHGYKAKYGWYRYNTRLALPVYNDMGALKILMILKE